MGLIKQNVFGKPHCEGYSWRRADGRGHSEAALAGLRGQGAGLYIAVVGGPGGVCAFVSVLVMLGACVLA